MQWRDNEATLLRVVMSVSNQSLWSLLRQRWRRLAHRLKREA
jgi:hypothetical protein